MIISTTPFRISFFGGGTDYPVWSREYGGAVLSSTINKYCYISARYLPPFFEHNTRIVWSKIESVQDVEEIQHPSVRETMKYMGFIKGLEIHHDADLPARSGIGSSSSFTVGLLNSLYALKGMMVSKEKLAQDAIHIEQNILKENVGSQDQVAVAYGGFNKIEFKKDGTFHLTPIIMKHDKLKYFQDHFMLIFSGFSRNANEIAKEQIKETPNKKNELRAMYHMVDEAIDILTSDRELSEFGKLLHENWMQKKSISQKISTDFIDEIYTEALNAGAIGGKICGAGGGGFLLLFAKPQDKPKIKARLNKLLHVPFEFETQGSYISLYQPNGLWEKHE